jgi:AraC family transcriptional regulator
MSRNIDLQPEVPFGQTPALPHIPLLNVVEIATPRGQWMVPAVKEVSLALSLSNFSARWRGPQGFRSETVNEGTIAICEFDRERVFEAQDAAKFGIVLLRNEALEQVRYDGRRVRTELQVREVLLDSTLHRLLDAIVHEKRGGFKSGSFFLDSMATALASYLVRHYSTAHSIGESSRGGIAPAVLRRCIELMEASLDRNLRLSELAREAGLSTSHFLRSFRQSTGKTPYQFLLQRRVERARALMRDHRVSLTEVALASGFADQHHLARVFRQITSMTPTSYRRSLQ